MIKGKFLRNISANTFQLTCNQLFGLAIFYVLSTELDKTTFGQINLVLAVLLTAFHILSFGIDQVLVRKIAAREDPSSLLNTYVAHVLITGTLFYASLLIINLFIPGFSGVYTLLLLIGIGKVMIFFSTPFKQLATGLEQFRVFAWMSIISNIVRGTCLIIVALAGQISLETVVILFIAGDLAELLTCIYLSKKQLKILPRFLWDKEKHIQLIKDSLPQLGVVIFTSALSRLDWIFIGLLVSAAKLAEYSFAYKVFEITTLPLLALAPLLIPKFTKLFAGDDTPRRIKDLGFLLRMEIVVASAIALFLNILWIPLIDMATQGKYGEVNSLTILILSFSMPLLYFNNFLWSINFAKGKLKMIFHVIMVAFIVNVAGAFILIPFFKNEGAAAAYVLAILIQSILYIRKSGLSSLSVHYNAVWIIMACGILSYMIASVVFVNPLHTLLAALLIFVSTLLVTRQLRFSDWKDLKALVS